jgi:hypothetical protein
MTVTDIAGGAFATPSFVFAEPTLRNAKGE